VHVIGRFFALFTIVARECALIFGLSV